MPTPEDVRRRQKETLGLTLLILAFVIGASIYQFAVINPGLSDQDAQIKANRESVIFKTCQETNRRHRETLNTLRDLVSQQSRRHPQRRVELRASFERTRLLIDSLVPHRNCTHRVEQLTD